MENEFWINLPSKNLEKAKEFFVKIGFAMNERHQAPHMVSMFLGAKKVVVNLFTEELFMQFNGGLPINNLATSGSFLFSLSASSPQEVDALADRAVAAGAQLFGKPGYKDGWMYGCGFADLDGHRWNLLYMDLAKMPR